jgi:hypothetical protein
MKTSYMTNTESMLKETTSYVNITLHSSAKNNLNLHRNNRYVKINRRRLTLVKSNNEKSKSELNKVEEFLLDKTENVQVDKNITSAKDGIRYDYNDSSDFNEDNF